MTSFQFVEYEPYGGPTRDPSNELRATAAPDELVSASFGVYSATGVEELTFGPSKLFEEDVDAIDLRIVKVWAQAGVGV